MDFELSEELKMIRNTVRRFVEEEMIPYEGKVPEDEDIPQELRKKLENKVKAMGFWAPDAPTAYGGGGLGEVAMCLVLEELSKTALVPSRAPSVFGGYNGSILYHCNEEQKGKYLMPLIKGEAKTCFAQTEPNAGSDPAQMETRADKDGDCYIVNGTKTFITGADKADFIQLIAITDKSKGAHGGISCLLVDQGTPGMKVTSKFDMLGPEKPCELTFEDCRVPAANLVGQEGEGFVLAQKWLSIGRLRHGPKAVGVAQRALEIATEYAKNRVTFGKPLADRQGIQWMLVDSAVDIHAARMMYLNCAWKADQGKETRQEASMVKFFADEMAFKVIDRAIQILGGIGLSKECPLERMFRDFRSRRITEGASEIHRFVIARNIVRGMVETSIN